MDFQVKYLGRNDEYAVYNGVSMNPFLKGTRADMETALEALKEGWRFGGGDSLGHAEAYIQAGANGWNYWCCRLEQAWKRECDGNVSTLREAITVALAKPETADTLLAEVSTGLENFQYRLAGFSIAESLVRDISSMRHQIQRHLGRVK